MTSRPTRTAVTRLALVAAVGVWAVLPALLSPGSAFAGGLEGRSARTATSASVPAGAAAAAGWLAGERDAEGGVPGPFAGTDWGLTIDTLWALRAGGANAVDLQRTWAAVAANAGELAGPPSWSQDTTLRYGGGTAKLLVAAESMEADPRAVSIGGGSGSDEEVADLVERTLDLVSTTGPQAGRLTDSASAGYDSTNLFSQALAVIGLSEAGVVGSDDAPTLSSAVTFLRSQQCAPGWYRVFYDDGLTCDAALAKGSASGDVDGTAMAVQALVAARDAGASVPSAAIDAGVGWLLLAQHSDGSFGGGASTSGANANSTGLAAVALDLTGHAAQAETARAWVAGLQVSPAGASGVLAGEQGAIAYDAAALADARTHGLGAARDQWRRTTAQAVFALHPVALAHLADLPLGGGVTPPTGTPTTPATTPPSTPPTTGQGSPTTRPATSPTTPAPAGAEGSSTLPPASSGPSGGSAQQGGRVPPGLTGPGDGPGRTPSSGGGTATPTPSARPVPTATGGPLVTPLVPSPAATAGARPVSASAATTAPWRSPLVLAVAAGVLLGLVVVLRPWRLALSRGAGATRTPR